MNAPTVRELNLLKKNELLQLVQYYKLTADAALSKSQAYRWYILHFTSKRNSVEILDR